MNAVVKKAFAKLSELPKPLQTSVAKQLVANVDKWQALKRDVSAGFASGPPEPLDIEKFKVAARRRLRIRPKRDADR